MWQVDKNIDTASGVKRIGIFRAMRAHRGAGPLWRDAVDCSSRKRAGTARPSVHQDHGIALADDAVVKNLAADAAPVIGNEGLAQAQV